MIAKLFKHLTSFHANMNTELPNWYLGLAILPCCHVEVPCHIPCLMHWIEPLTLEKLKGLPRFDSCQCLALFVLQQDTLSTLLLSTQVQGVGSLWGDKALEGQAIVCEQWFAPPMLCLLRTFRRRSLPRCINGVPGRIWTLFCCLMWHVCAPEVAPGQNAP